MNRYRTEDLVQAVSEIIASEDSACADRFDSQFRKHPSDPTDAIIELNRYWRMQLGQLPVNTTSERECLIDIIEPHDWLRHFQNGVLPTIIRFDLPRMAA